ncbi:MAG: flippase-like domain-containing protein [Bacteroidia bacterium]|nr:flippase-like domain-containing protein [Bacteroidia bacterium]MCF8426280.1 flippase-like domain-containing protein [Bacteroidia bacterium]MCF8445485.1 flippase-like domain-containing protein [Bacteroidia bacterium]
MKKAIQYGIILLVGGLFLYFVFKDTNWTDLFQKMSSANLYWLALGVFISLISHWIRAYRATLLYDAMHFKISTTHSFYAVLIGYMMNYIIPRAGEVSRCAALSKTDDLPVEKSLGSVVTERIVDMFLLILVLGVIFLIQFDLISQFLKDTFENKNEIGQGNEFSWKFILLIGLIAIVILLFSLRKKLAQSSLVIRLFKMVQGFGDGLLSIRHVKNPSLFISLSVLIWIGYILMMYVCLFSLEATSHLNFVDCLTVFAIGTIGVVLPAPGAGAGTYHFFVMQSLLLYGVSKEDGIAYATMVHGIQMIVLLILGAIASIIVMGKQKSKINE